MSDSRTSALELIRALSKMNPTGDLHGSMDPPFTKACAEFDPDMKTETPLTLEEWKVLREGGNYSAALSRNILDATDPFVFLAVLRDRLVHVAGSTEGVIAVISAVLDAHINSRTMNWVEDDPPPPPPRHITVQESAAALPTVEMLIGLDVDEAIDLLYNATDDALWAGHYEGGAWPHLESWVATIEPSDLSTELVVAFLCGLLAMRNANQPWYATWYARARTVLLERESPERMRGLLDGLGPKEPRTG